ncbi:hypothetical protein GCM10010483_36720 [Actinokineospora diospyrosa]
MDALALLLVLISKAKVRWRSTMGGLPVSGLWTAQSFHPGFRRSLPTRRIATWRLAAVIDGPEWGQA